MVYIVLAQAGQHDAWSARWSRLVDDKALLERDREERMNGASRRGARWRSNASHRGKLRRETTSTVRSLPRIACLIALGIGAGCRPYHSTPVPASATPATPPIVAPPTTAPPAESLNSVVSFDRFADPAERSRALFVEMSRVMLHPRCANCHPDGDSPLQTDRQTLHDPPVARGDDSHGLPALRCTSCHQDQNLDLARVPGAPKWALAPRAMAWVGRTPHALCEQLKDLKRNGGKTLPEIVEHAAHDELVAWGWAPGHARAPAPGTQAEFGALVAAWVTNGAACPAAEKEEQRP